MLRHYCPLSFEHLFLSDSDTESDDNGNHFTIKQRKGNKKDYKGKTIGDKGKCIDTGNGKRKFTFDEGDKVAEQLKTKAKINREDLVKLAKEYQNHMKNLAVPRARVPIGMFVTWKGLAKTMKNLYGQPLHYLTHMLCKQWDAARFGSEDGGGPMEGILSGWKAEAIIWHVEVVHRLCTSHIYLAMLWHGDPEYRDYADQVIPPS